MRWLVPLLMLALARRLAPSLMLVAKCRLVPLIVLSLASYAVQAHRLSPAFFGMTETSENIYAAQWKVSISGGLADTLSPQLPEGCAVAGPARVYVLDDISAPNDIRLQHATVACEQPLAGKIFRIAGLESTGTDVLLRIDYADGRSFTHRLVPDDPSVVIPERPGTFDTIATYTGLGVDHILRGVDHLLFVFALLLIVRGWRRLVWTITAFTAAHSITLAAATLGVVSVSSAAVEATIALSILFLAVELARRQTGSTAGATSVSTARAKPSAGTDLIWRYPWVVAFAFGLLHGFGFAGALREIGLPEQAVPLALLFFNVGVELGQLLFVGAVLALGLLLRNTLKGMPGFVPRAAAYVIGSVAALWVIERTLTAI